MRADVGHSEAAVQQANAEYEYANNNLHRLEPLLAKQFVTVDQVDQARTATKARAEAVRQATAQLTLSQARLNSALAQKANRKPRLNRAMPKRSKAGIAVDILSPLTEQRGSRAAAVVQRSITHSHCRVYAPFDARVTNLTTSEGAFAHVGTQLFTLIDTRVSVGIANYRETQLRNIHPGTKADVYLMPQADRRFNGVVDSIGIRSRSPTRQSLASSLPDCPMRSER